MQVLMHGIPINFHEESGIVTFWSNELRAALDVSKECEALCPDRWRTMAFSRISTGDSVIPSSCEMKYEPAFKPMQGNPAFFWVRASRSPFHLRQKTQSPSHIPISERGSSWGACEKLSYIFSRRQGIIIIPRWYGVHRTFLQLLYWNWWSSILESVVSGVSRGS